MTTPTQGEHAQTELAHELFAAAQLAPGEGIEDAVSRIAAALTAAPAQPAAHVQKPAEIEHVADDLSKNGAESNRTSASLSEFQEGQWWVNELDAMVSPPIDQFVRVTADMKRAVAVVHHLLRASNGQAPAGETSEPIAYLHDDGYWTPAKTAEGRKLNDRLHFAGSPKIGVHLAPTAQAAPAAADFTTLGAALRAIQQAIDLIGEPADDRMRTVKRVLRGAVIVAEDSGELSAPAAGAVAGTEDVQRARNIAAIAQRWIGDRTHLGALVYLDDLAWALKTLAAAPTPAAQADSVLEDAARWQALPAFFEEYQIDAMKLYRDIDAALAARKQGAKHD